MVVAADASLVGDLDRSALGLGLSAQRRVGAGGEPSTAAALWVALALFYLLAGGLRGCLRGCEGFDYGGCAPVGSPARAGAESAKTGAAVPWCR